MNDKENQIEICENCKIKDTCSNRILVHMENCKVNDCDYYCESTDIEKEIEEMAREIAKKDCYLFEKCPKEPKHNCLSQNPAIMLESSKNYITIATRLYNAGYRQFKDTAEKYQARIDELEEEIDMLIKEQKEDRSYEIEQTRKETAREIIKSIKQKYGISCRQYYPFLLIECLSSELDELAKEYGVEVE